MKRLWTGSQFPNLFCLQKELINTTSEQKADRLWIVYEASFEVLFSDCVFIQEK